METDITHNSNLKKLAIKDASINKELKLNEIL
jgi:hypothetical protein